MSRFKHLYLTPQGSIWDLPDDAYAVVEFIDTPRRPVMNVTLGERLLYRNAVAEIDVDAVTAEVERFNADPEAGRKHLLADMADAMLEGEAREFIAAASRVAQLADHLAPAAGLAPLELDWDQWWQIDPTSHRTVSQATITADDTGTVVHVEADGQVVPLFLSTLSRRMPTLEGAVAAFNYDPSTHFRALHMDAIRKGFYIASYDARRAALAMTGRAEHMAALITD